MLDECDPDQAITGPQSRHPQLDLDPSEFGAGFRIVPSTEGSERLHLDVYLYDTLSGGAGYAELAGRHLDEILDNVLALLENCHAHCDRSCENCLRHYHNQHLRDRLDRFVGAQLLRYARSGKVPAEASPAAQAADLQALARLLQLDGFVCTPLAQLDSQTIPLLVTQGNNAVVVGVQSALLAANWTATPSRGCHRAVRAGYSTTTSCAETFRTTIAWLARRYGRARNGYHRTRWLAGRERQSGSSFGP